MITITVDEFHSKSSSDNGLRLSNGTSPSLSANHNSGLETHDKNKNGSSLTHSYSEVFMNNDCIRGKNQCKIFFDIRSLFPVFQNNNSVNIRIKL